MTESSTRRVAVYPGSFDPPTLGHLDVISRASALFDGLVVGVLVNPAKQGLLPLEQRVRLLQTEIADAGLPNVSVRTFEGLTIDFAKANGARWIVRGVRSQADLADETSMAGTNRLAAGGNLETIFLPARPELAFVQARYVRQIATGGGSIDGMVSARVAAALKKKLN